jgi:hypothetical protein
MEIYMTKLSKLEKFLKSGASATPKQITGMFGIANPSAAIHQLRSNGVCVYTNQSQLRDGTQTVRYQIGRPTKKMVKALHALGFFG